MEFDTFVSAIRRDFPVGTAFDNPGGGTSTVTGFTESHISYRRGKSRISVSLRDLYEAYSNFVGQDVTTSNLRAFRPAVFDSSARPAGHSCNCTFLFGVLEVLGLSGPINGAGVGGSPFSVKIRECPRRAD